MLFNCKPQEASIDKAIIEDLVANGITVIPKNEENTHFKVSLARQRDIKNETWIAIRVLRNNISELDLNNSSFQEKAGLWVAEMSNLEVLNLNGSDAGDVFLDKISSLKNLKKIDLTGTQASGDRIAILMDEIEGLEVVSTEEDNAAKISAPVISAPQQIFNDEVEVKLSSPSKNVKMYYTLDGSDPDETSKLYEAPFKLSKSTLLKTVASKIKGQLGKVGLMQFIQTEAKPKKISLVSPPSEKYKAQGAQSLFDFKRGGSNFSTNYWLGYQGEHLTTVVELEKEQEIKGVYVSSLQDQNNWIHYPEGLKIWGSKNKRDYKLIGETSFGAPKVEGEMGARFFKLNFDPVKAKFVKIQVLSQLKNPSWHMSAGEPCWVFVDEIVIE